MCHAGTQTVQVALKVAVGEPPLRRLENFLLRVARGVADGLWGKSG